MPSPHTLGSIMHQPLAALTPLLLFPLENRTSTHPPSTPVNPPHPTGRPSCCVALLGHPRAGSLLVAVSLAFVRQSSTAGTTFPVPTFAILRILSSFRTERDSRPISRFLLPLLVVDLLRGVSTSLTLSSRSHPFFPTLLPFLVLTSLSLALLKEASLVFVAISVSSSSLLPSSQLLFRGSLFVGSPFLFVLLQPTRFIIVVLYPLHEHAHSSIHTHILSHTEKCFLRLSLSSTILLHPFSTLLVLLSLLFVARLPRVFSLTIAQKILPSRHTESPSKRDRLPPSTPSILLPFSSIVAEGEERASVLHESLFRACRNSHFDETPISLSYRKAFKHCLPDRLFPTRTRRRDSEKPLCAFFYCSLLYHRGQHHRARIPLYAFLCLFSS